MTDEPHRYERYPILHVAVALERMDSDQDLYREIVHLFYEDTPDQMAELRKALESDDMQAAVRRVHSIKSSAANVGAERLVAVTAELERVGRRKEFQAFRGGIPKLEDTVRELLELLEKRYLHRASA